MAPAVVLREVIEADLPAFFEWQRDPVSTAMADFPARDRETFDAHWAKILVDPTTVLRTIVADGAVAGHLVAFHKDGRHLVGYWLGRDYWGKGIATVALARFLEIVPERPLHASVAKSNIGSVRVLEKCGFTVVEEETIVENGVETVDLLMGLEA